VEREVTVIDDFAHHPTEVRETVAAMRKAYPSGRLIAVFEPRTNTSRQKFFQNEYVSSFAGADYVLLREPPDPEKFPPDNRFSSRQLAGDLRQRGIEAFSFDSTDGVIERIILLVRPDDTVLVMSNGGFDNIHNRLLKELAGGA
jgi:UDP-N-acetylmuramate: L-alanyl-gamma-D-glutamyl-meso-diaminopimelate ligase